MYLMVCGCAAEAVGADSLDKTLPRENDCENWYCTSLTLVIIDSLVPLRRRTPVFWQMGFCCATFSSFSRAALDPSQEVI